MLGTPPVGRHRLEPQTLVRLNIFHLHTHVHGDAAYNHVDGDGAYNHVDGDAAYDDVDGDGAQAGEPGRAAAGGSWSSTRRPAFPIQPSRPPYKVIFI